MPSPITHSASPDKNWTLRVMVSDAHFGAESNVTGSELFADARFPADGAVELHFSSGPEGRHPVPAPTPAVPFTLADDPITRADSPLAVEEYEEDDSDSGRSNIMFRWAISRFVLRVLCISVIGDVDAVLLRALPYSN